MSHPPGSCPVEVCLLSSLGRISRISSSSFRIVRWFSSSLHFGPMLLLSFPIIDYGYYYFSFWYYSFGMVLSLGFRFILLKETLSDFLTGSGVLGFSIYIPCSGVTLLSFRRSCNSSSMFVCIGFPSDLMQQSKSSSSDMMLRFRSASLSVFLLGDVNCPLLFHGWFFSLSSLRFFPD